jgi:hypothetical protein
MRKAGKQALLVIIPAPGVSFPVVRAERAARRDAREFERADLRALAGAVRAEAAGLPDVSAVHRAQLDVVMVLSVPLILVEQGLRL